MKKRLLITSIVMMLVVAVALSTATYAWFTSNDTVSASSITMTAATSDEAALGIGWTDGNPSTELVASNTGTFYPMAPASLTVGTTLYDVAFNSATIRTVDNVSKFKDVTACDGDTEHGKYDKPVTFNNGASDTAYRDTFYVKNLSTANSITQVTITASIENVYENVTEPKAAAGYKYYTDGKVAVETTVGEDLPGTATKKVKIASNLEAADLVRIAVFKKDGANGYKLVGVMAKTADVNTVYGTPVADKNATAVAANAVDANNPMANYTATAAGSTGLTLGSLGTEAQHDLAIVVWLDGALLDDDHQGYQATVSFSFAASRS